MRKELSADSTAPLAVYHKLGAVAKALMSDRTATYRRQLSSALAELVGRTPSVIYQARKFQRFYSADQVAELEGNLSWGRIVALVSIDDDKQRRLIQEKCIDQNWSVGQLTREIRTRFGRQRHWAHGGQVSRPPRNVIEAMTELDRMLSAVVRWYRSLQRAALSGATAGSKRPFDLAQFPPVLRRRIAGAIGGLEELLEVVEYELERRTGESDP